MVEWSSAKGVTLSRVTVTKRLAWVVAEVKIVECARRLNVTATPNLVSLVTHGNLADYLSANCS